MVTVIDTLWMKACDIIELKGNEHLSISERHKIRFLLILGSEGVGKTELLNGFFDRMNGSANAKTLAMDYTFGRRSGRSLEKNIANVWELGGGTALLSTTDSVLSTAAESAGMAGLVLILMLDLSLPNKLWTTLDDCLKHIRATIKKQTSHKFPTFHKDLQSEAWKRVGGKTSANKSYLDPFPVPLVIIGGKYDIFQDFESEKRKVICHCLRYAAHTVGAFLLFYSSKDVGLVKRARDALMLYGFSHNAIVPPVCHDYNKPLFIPAGSDSLDNIATTLPILTKLSGRDCFLSHFPQDVDQSVMPEDPAKDVNFREVAIDNLRAFKEEELKGFTR